MKTFQRQVDYWAHMLDECKLDEASDESTSSPDTLTAGTDDSTEEIVDDVMDDELEEVCQNLEFLLHSDDDKARALYAKFKEGFKDKFSDLKCKVGYVSIKNLHPTQNVIFLTKSIKPMLDGSWTDKDHGGQPVIKSLLDKHDSKEMKLGYLVVCNVSGTNYLIDGHHRWSKAYMMNPNSKLYAYVLPSDGVFKTEDDVLKFAQCEIALYLGRGNQKNHPVNASANKAGDTNIYEASSETIKQKVNEFLTDEVVKIFADKSNVLGGKTDTREKIADYVAGNKEVMVKNAPAGVHDRTYMPQYPDSNGPGEALQKVNEGISRKMKKDMKKKYTKKQIMESIKYWQKQLRAGNYKKLDESCLNEGLFSWLGNLFSTKEKAASGMKDGDISVQSRVIEDYLDAAKKYVQKAYKDEDWNKAGTAAIQAGDAMNSAWNSATSSKDRESIARVAVALAAKLQYAKSNSSYEYVCVTFCNKLDEALQNKAKTMTSNALIKKSLSGWSGPDWKKSDKKGIPGVGWNYDPARNGWSYDDGY